MKPISINADTLLQQPSVCHNDLTDIVKSRIVQY